ncbi:alpha/beta hydrolase fold protein [Rhodothermus marinus SG0.5JP17-172]|uniref:alpha/beta fold hydrolase n=1 Tax=Rhodothermus marinus TaxID=29549 RepID=UPI000223D8E3|nr:alpha/beta hydrolase [Rhodothermus marinus]AEN73442.1 alpha/beta hydrolase fold protein [Rhodothermus marinus SG0.5JP17-172]
MITYRIATELGPVRVVTDGIYRPGPPIIWLHGWTLSPWGWVALMPPALRTRRHWYALSLPGHLPDEDGPLTPLLTPERLAEALAQAIQDLCGETPVQVVGHSLGGFWGLCLAVHRPSRLERLVLVSSFARGRLSGALARVQQMADHGAGRWLFRLGYRWLTARPERWRRLLVRLSGRPEAWQETAGQVFFESVYPDAKRYRPDVLLQLAAAMAHMDLTEQLASVQCPVLMIAGESDPVVPVTHVREMADRLPKARLEVLPGVGHVPIVEAPEAVCALLEQFLSVEKPLSV